LIGRQLWTEFSNTQSVNVPNFILRRAFRIWPLYFVVFAIGFVYSKLAGKDFGPLWPELVFVSNYVRGKYVPGSWSLATEEQFYIVVPLTVLFISYFTQSLKAARCFFYALLLAVPVGRIITWKLAGGTEYHDHQLVLDALYFPFHTHCDGLVFGVLLANLKAAKEQGWFYNKPWIFLLASLPVAFFLRRMSPIYFNYMSIALVFGALLWFCVQSKTKNLIVKFLSMRVFYVISKLSFGMYLMHQYALKEISHFVIESMPSASSATQFLIVLVLNTALTVASAMIGFAVIEHPFLRLRGRLGFGASH